MPPTVTIHRRRLDILACGVSQVAIARAFTAADWLHIAAARAKRAAEHNAVGANMGAAGVQHRMG